VALVEIIDARHIESNNIHRVQGRYPYYKPWRVAGSVIKMLSDGASPELVLFDRGWSSCDDRRKIPHKGEKWMIYYTSSQLDQADNIVESYPLAVAKQADPRLQAHNIPSTASARRLFRR
jgi:hypothetical protein